MSGLGHYLEEEGIATTQISLIREHTEITKPPRALWVPFELGRPFGVPNDAQFQTRVLVEALKLFDAPAGPLLVDFPDDAPDRVPHNNHFVCPVNFAIPSGEQTSNYQILETFKSEAANLTAWYRIALNKNGRTTVGVSNLKSEEIVKLLVSFIEGSLVIDPLANVTVTAALRMAVEDLKAIYFEGASAQPGGLIDSTAMANWFWGDTVAAKVINIIRKISLERQESDYQMLGKLLLIPRIQLYRFS